MSPGKGVPSRGVVAARVEFLMAASLAWVTSSSLWARPSGRLSLKDIIFVAVSSGAMAMLYVVCRHVRQPLAQPPTNPGRPRAPGQRIAHVAGQTVGLASTRGVPAPYPCSRRGSLRQLMEINCSAVCTLHPVVRARFKVEMFLTCDAGTGASGR